LKLEKPKGATAFSDLQQTWPLPSVLRPITIIGAGDIVKTAHLPAYRKLGFPIAGIFDLNRRAAQTLAQEFDVAQVFESLDDAIDGTDSQGVYDIALPPAAILPTVSQLPKGSVALIQKPLGENLTETRKIISALDSRNITAATNFQLRFTPSMLAIRDAVRRGILGTIVDVEVRLAVYMPWENWSFIPTLDAVEIPLHSIHYLDWIRSLLGEPASVFAKSVANPRYPDLSDSRSSIILDYGNSVRCCLSLNHTYNFGPELTQATIRVEGTKGCAHLDLGYLLDYVHPSPERLQMVTVGGTWTDIPLIGERVPDSFGSVMANLQRYVASQDDVLDTDVHDSFATMALVEAALESSRRGGVVPKQY
jgi:predicted dehydrogenase